MTCLANLRSTFTVSDAQRERGRRDGAPIHPFHFGYQDPDHPNPRRSVTLVGEADRKLLKAAIKHSSDQDKVRHRVVPAEAVSKWAEKLESMKLEISEVLQEEKEEKQVSC